MQTSINKVMSNKSLASCMFDLVNTKNPSGGMIGPGNCQWFHNIVLRLMGTVGEDLQKLLKNHAVVDNAWGFMLLHNDIGSCYVFGLFPHNVINVSSAGALRGRLGHWISMISAMGQLSGLTAMYYLMKHLTAPFFNIYDNQDSREHCMCAFQILGGDRVRELRMCHPPYHPFDFQAKV